MAPVYGFQGQLGIDTVNPVTKRFDFQSEALALAEHLIDANGLRGTRERDISRVRQGNRRCGGQIHLQPTSLELSNLLAWFLGGTPTGTGAVSYPLADALSLYYITVDRGAKVFTYSGCAVDKATIRGRQGEPLDVLLDIVGQDETVGNSGSFPVLTIDHTTQPFIFTDLVLDVGGSPYTVKEFELIIDNMIDKERFYNSQTLSAVIATDRLIHWNLNVPYGTASAIYGTGTSGAAALATFTGPGTEVLTFGSTKVAFPRESPSFTAARGEVMLRVPGIAYADAANSNPSLTTTLHQ